MSYVEIAVILDRSGSMATMQEEAIGGYNNFLTEQKKIDSEAKLTTVLFDDQYELLHDGLDLQDVKEIDKTIFVPRGCTALLDAIGKTINTISERIDKMDEKERPSKIVVAILTDGYENASKEFKKEKINEMIKFYSEGDWEFNFLAANQDAIETGISYGINASGCYNYTADSVGTRSAFNTISYCTTNARNSVGENNEVDQENN